MKIIYSTKFIKMRKELNKFFSILFTYNILNILNLLKKKRSNRNIKLNILGFLNLMSISSYQEETPHFLVKFVLRLLYNKLIVIISKQHN